VSVSMQDTFEINQVTLKIHVSFRIHAGYINIHQDTYPI
jgi:hypothetical protein